MFEEQKISKRGCFWLILLLIAVCVLPLCKCNAQDELPFRAKAQTAIKPTSQQTEAKMDTVVLDYGAIKNIFGKTSSSGKSVRYYVVYTYKGEQDITTTGKSVLEYIEICKEAGINPRLALKVKDGRVVSIIKAPSKMKL